MLLKKTILVEEATFSHDAKRLVRFLRDHDGEDLTFKDIAAGLDMKPRAANCMITSSLVNRGYAVRELQPDGGTNYIRLTDKGRTADLDETTSKTIEKHYNQKW